jgi:D-inositol-3-phosphate glycosyltransferase
MARAVVERAVSYTLPRRIATLSVHTSPLHQPGTGDAGGMNVYIVEVSKRLAHRGIEVEIFTRTTSSGLPAVAELAPGVKVRHVNAGPFEGLAKEDLPAQLCAFTHGVLRAEASRPPGYYDLLHSHYWLSGQVGWLAKDRWGVPLVHTAHTLAKVKNLQLAEGDKAEPVVRVIGEEQVVDQADRLIANTPTEARELIDLYQAPLDQVAVVSPGVDLTRFKPGSRLSARERLGLPMDRRIVAFVGRIQPLKAPDVLVQALAALPSDAIAAIVGGPSGPGLSLVDLARSLGVLDRVHFLPPQTGERLADVYLAADLVAVPSYNESFGLVALEAQACGTPVVAAAVGGLVTAVRDGISGVLIDGHDPSDWARVLGGLLASPACRADLAEGALKHACDFSWERTVDSLLAVYSDVMVENRIRQRRELARC